MKGTWELLKQTTPFIWMRMLIYLMFAVGSVLLLAIVVGLSALLIKWFGDSSILILFLLLATLGIIFTAFRLLERYVLYLLKAAHIAVLIELIDHGQVPDGKGQIAYGKERVSAMFGTTSIFFAVDQLVSASVKQIHKWLMRLGDFLNVIPGAKIIISIISSVLGVALNYIDEAVLSRVMKHKKEDPETNVWKTSADGVVLYAQSWKGMIGTATGVALFSIVLSIATFFITLFPLLALVNRINDDAGALLGALAFISALSISFAVKKALVDPIATIAMIRTYHLKTAGVTPSIDLMGKMVAVSAKFKELFHRSDNEQPIPAPATNTFAPVPDTNQFSQ
ncbi:MAG: hypothetical protein P0Y55_02610 [Candidatus Cohnella colombiensis]|uniref:Uncharacterized protein n=1 Tax=Candidatus Cohnella colombiensis TaxID=3121368 RepID=A0AA95F514_9BACL|nr:MAG: hypothetical protein P0Y55_02610 [Cohnella sp.]